MDSLFTILFLIGAGIVAFLNQKAKAERERREQENSQPPGDENETGQTQQTKPARPASSWEAELRRLLDGEETETTPPPAPPPRPSPIIIVPRPVPSSAPPVTVVRPAPVRPQMVATRPNPPPAPAAPDRPPEHLAPDLTPRFSNVQTTPQELGKFKESQQAYARASQLDQTMAQYIDRIPGQRVTATKVTHRAISPEVAKAVSLFQNPASARQAVLASIILGPPRSIEDAPASGGISW